MKDEDTIDEPSHLEDEYLQKLSDLLNELSSKPYDYSLHAQHVQLSITSKAPDQVISAGKLMTTFWLAGDEVWLPIIDAKLAETSPNVEDVLAVFEEAETNYLC